MSRRLFFALWPDDRARKQLNSINKQAAAQHHGKQMHAANLHLTLVFLGDVSEAQHNCVVERAGEIQFTSFDLCLDHVGVFDHAKVLWLGLQDKPNALLELAEALQQLATDCGIVINNKPFYPHVTLMRKVSQLNGMQVEPVNWYVDRFCLVESITVPEGVIYKVINSWV